MRHEHRRGGGLRHTGRVSVPPSTVVWLSAVRSRQSWPLSRLSGPSQSRAHTPGAPEHPNSARQRRWLRPVRPLRRAHGPQSRQPADNRRVAVSHPTAAPATPQHRSRSRQQAAHAHRRDVAPASLTQSRAPSMRFLSPQWCTKLPLGRPNRSTLARTSLPLRTPFAHAIRLIQKRHPAILAVTGSDHSPVAFCFRNGWLFSPEYAPWNRTS